MGIYFMMSFHFDKSKASDFGLIEKNENTAIDPRDNSIWEKCALYDFGWGAETGFCKQPIPEFDYLINLSLDSTDRDDKYGAAAVILKKYPNKLLNWCEKHYGKNDFKNAVDIYNLKNPINRCASKGQSREQIKSDYTRWLKIAREAGKI